MQRQESLVRIPAHIRPTDNNDGFDLWCKWISARYWIATHEFAKARYHANRAYFNRKLREKRKESVVLFAPRQMGKTGGAR